MISNDTALKCLLFYEGCGVREADIEGEMVEKQL